jgi:hypothetical protein
MRVIDPVLQATLTKGINGTTFVTTRLCSGSLKQAVATSEI